MVNYSPTYVPFKNPVWNLSLLEIRALIDSSVIELSENESFYRGKKPQKSLRDDFEIRCLNIKDSLSKDAYLEKGQVWCEGSDTRWTATPDSEIYGDIIVGVSNLSAFSASHPVAAFSESIIRNVEWRRNFQIKTAEYLCGLQERYLLTGDVRCLQPISAMAVGKVVGLDKSSFYRLNNGFTINVNGLVPAQTIFARDLITSLSPEKNSLKIIIDEFIKDSKFFKNGVWQVSSRDMCDLIREKYGVSYSERTLSKYKSTISDKNLRTLVIKKK